MPLVSGSDGMQEAESDPETGRLVLKKLRVKWFHKIVIRFRKSCFSHNWIEHFKFFFFRKKKKGPHISIIGPVGERQDAPPAETMDE